MAPVGRDVAANDWDASQLTTGSHRFKRLLFRSASHELEWALGMNYHQSHILHALTRWATITASLAGGLFLVAGTTRIPRLRVYLAVFSVLLLLTMLAVDPGLAQERTHPGASGQDANERFGAGFLFLVTVGFAAMDVGRLHQSDAVPVLVSIVALAVFAAASALQIWAMIVNPFFSPVTRIQAERGHYLITRGPYRWLRHPGYLALLIAIPASALAIGSWLALIPASGFDLIILRRARGEDEFLAENLPGYREYRQHVRGGLFPTFRYSSWRGQQ
jgi:protein-S-isoprenylcysteine O-methyltransferase Ste14